MNLYQRLFLILFLLIASSCLKSGGSSSTVDYSQQDQEAPTYPEQPTPAPTPAATPHPAPKPEAADTIYYMSIYGDQVVDYNKPTHFFVVGDGDALVTLFQEAATGRLRRLQEVFPTHQFILINFNETLEHPTKDNLAQLKKWGYNLIKEGKGDALYDELDDDFMLDEMQPFTKVHSLDIFSHANTGYAIFNYYHYYYKHNINFVPTATISLFGCNAGFGLAEYLSEVFDIAVAGSLTSSDFQQLHSLDDFYRNDASLKPPGSWSSSNSLSFKNPVPCSQGACLRMKPDEFPYSGMHGIYDQGLPYYKFFCSDMTEQQCLQSKAQWILGVLSLKPLFPSSDLDTYKTVVRDVLCPNAVNTQLKSTCTEKLIEAETNPNLVYSPFKGKMPTCNWQGCDFYTMSDKTFIQEYHAFIQAYPYLKLAQ